MSGSKSPGEGEVERKPHAPARGLSLFLLALRLVGFLLLGVIPFVLLKDIVPVVALLPGPQAGLMQAFGLAWLYSYVAVAAWAIFSWSSLARSWWCLRNWRRCDNRAKGRGWLLAVVLGTLLGGLFGYGVCLIVGVVCAHVPVH